MATVGQGCVCRQMRAKGAWPPAKGLPCRGETVNVHTMWSVQVCTSALGLGSLGTGAEG